MVRAKGKQGTVAERLPALQHSEAQPTKSKNSDVLIPVTKDAIAGQRGFETSALPREDSSELPKTSSPAQNVPEPHKSPTGSLTGRLSLPVEQSLPATIHMQHRRNPGIRMLDIISFTSNDGQEVANGYSVEDSLHAVPMADKCSFGTGGTFSGRVVVYINIQMETTNENINECSRACRESHRRPGLCCTKMGCRPV